MTNISFDPELRSQMERHWPIAAARLLREIHFLNWNIIEEREFREGRRLRRPVKAFSISRRRELEDQIYDCWCADPDRCAILHLYECAVVRPRGCEELASNGDHIVQSFTSYIKSHAFEMVRPQYRAVSQTKSSYVALMNESSFWRAALRIESEPSINWIDDRQLEVKALPTKFYNAKEIQCIFHACSDALTGLKVIKNPIAFRLVFKRETSMAPTVTWKPRILPMYIDHLSEDSRISVLKVACGSLHLNRDEGIVAMYILGRLIESSKPSTVISSRELLDFEGLNSLDRSERAWRYYNYDRLLENLARFCVQVDRPDLKEAFSSTGELFSISHKKLEEGEGHNCDDPTLAPTHVTLAFDLVPGELLRTLHDNPKLSYPLMDIRRLGISPKRQPSCDWMVSIFLACLHLSRIKCKTFYLDEPMKFRIKRKTLLSKFPPNKHVHDVLQSDNDKRAPKYFSAATRLLPLNTFFEVSEESSDCIELERSNNKVITRCRRGWNQNDRWLNETLTVTVRSGTVLHDELAKVVRSFGLKRKKRFKKLT